MQILKLTLVLTLTLTFAFGTFVAAEEAHKVEMDKKVDDFQLKDVQGKTHSLKALSKDKKATVVMFIATQCPVSNAYNERMVKLFKDYKDQSIQFIGINSNRQESVEEIAQHSKEKGFEFIVLKDPQNQIADYFGARRTPEVYLLDEHLTLSYHGAIDNSQHNPEKHYLREVLDLAVAGKNIPTDLKETKAFGCSIKRVNAEGRPGGKS